MNWTLKDISKETSCPLHTVKRLFYSSRTEYEQFITRGSRNKILLRKAGKELLLKTICEQFENSSEPVIDNRSNNWSQRTVIKQVNNNSIIGQLQDTINMLRADLTRERNEKTDLIEMVSTLQKALTETQHRHDTIVMSLSNRMEDIQKRLPAPPETTLEPKPQRVSLWQKFTTWLSEDPGKLQPEGT